MLPASGAVAYCWAGSVCCVLAIQPIKIETSPGKVEMAIMHAAELEHTTQEDQRCVAMLHQFPIHAMLFSSNGRLVHGNKAAMSKFHTVLEGMDFKPH